MRLALAAAIVTLAATPLACGDDDVEPGQPDAPAVDGSNDGGATPSPNSNDAPTTSTGSTTP